MVEVRRSHRIVEPAEVLLAVCASAGIAVKDCPLCPNGRALALESSREPFRKSLSTRGSAVRSSGSMPDTIIAAIQFNAYSSVLFRKTVWNTSSANTSRSCSYGSLHLSSSVKWR